MKSIGCLIALFSAAFWGVNCVAGETTKPPKLNVGDIWTYRITSEEPNSQPKIGAMQYEVLRKNSDEIAIAIEKGDLAHIIRNADHRDVRQLRAFPSSPCLFDPIADTGRKQLLNDDSCPYPLKAGMIWKQDDIDLGRPVIRTSLVIDAEKVTVPAGQFNAFKIEETIADAIESEAASLVAAPKIQERCNRWYSAEAKIVVKEVCDLYFGRTTLQHRNTFELAAYELH